MNEEKIQIERKVMQSRSNSQLTHYLKIKNDDDSKINQSNNLNNTAPTSATLKLDPS